MTSYTNEKGATLIEVLGVLAVVATIATGMFTGIARVNQKLKITQAQNQVSDIVKAMRTQFASFHPSSVTAEGLEKIGVYKAGTVDETGMAVSVFDTEMTMELSSDGENPFFIFSYKNVPRSSCYDLLLGDWGNDPSSGLKEIKVEGNAVHIFQWAKDSEGTASSAEDDASSLQHTLLPTPTTAINACAQEQNVTISWSYYI